MGRTIAVVAHTHWDREWYAPFEHFRTRLTNVLDELLLLLESDPSFRQFLLDGQMAMIDDYLAVRPDAVDNVRRLVVQGRLAIGPWYILMDEFCTSGETIVRNLQLGLRRAADLGGAMAVGYLPDMFGHIAQMPQILRLAGLEHAVVWRGVPSAVDRTAFWWEAPDGSTVRAEYLPVGYANGAHLPVDAGALIRRMEAHEAELAPLLGGRPSPILLMNGADQQPPQPHLPTVLDQANAEQERFDFRQMSLAEYLALSPSDGLPRWAGELRSGSRANILMGVLSNRVDIKIAGAVAERSIERVAEPLAALWLPADEWPVRLLDEAWTEVIRNSAHDSICACSSDTVGRAVVHRYDTAATLADLVTELALRQVEQATTAAGHVVVNPGAAATSGVVEAVVAGSQRRPGMQVIAVTEDATEERSGVGADLARMLGELTEDGWLIDGRPVEAEVILGAGVEVVLEADESRRPSRRVPEVMAEAWAQAGAHRDEPLHVRVERRASQRVVLRVAEVPGYGWAPLDPAPSDGTEVRAGGSGLHNSLVALEVDRSNGTFSLNGLAGFDQLIDEGDEGDTYNYCPPRCDLAITQPEPESVQVELLEGGPARGRLRISRRFGWPTSVDRGIRVGRQIVEVVSEVELRAGEPLVRVTTRFDNRSRDHRVRTRFPLPRATDHTVAECAFGTVTRGAPEGSPRELPLATFPSRRFVSAGGLTVTHEGLLEYELIDDGTALALTLLRATGVLSRPAPFTRPNSAGPADHLDGPQLAGPHQVRYALALDVTNPWRLADLAWLPLHVVPSSGDGRLGPAGSRLTVRGVEVSALHRVDGAIELRVFNPSDRATMVEVPGRSGRLVDLRGQLLETWHESFGLRPWGIATARLDATALDP